VDAVEWYLTRKFPFVQTIDWLVGMNGSYRLLDGAIGISSLIQKKFIRMGIPAIRIPSVLNVDQILKENGSKAGNDFVYVGQFKADEAVDDLIDGFRIARERGCPANLKIVGNIGMKGGAARIRTRIHQDPALADSVHFTGRLPDDEFSAQLQSARALILLRKPTLRARAAFPTRIPEFLATANPVITTDVPDIPEYLKDGIHAHILPTGKPEIIAECMVDICRQPQKHVSIGQAGRRRLAECFDYRIHTRRLLSFVNEMHAPH
jgi:glycosyltransferase involved in cell wall biosynthesis